MSASPASPYGARLLVLALPSLVAACGARDGFSFPDDLPGRSAAGGSHPSSDPVLPGGGPGLRGDGSTDVRDARGDTWADATSPRRPRDASVDAPRDAASDAAFDGPSAPDCTCPEDDYFVDAVVGGVSQRFTEPYGLVLYCLETAVQLVHTPCGELYSLSACAGPHYGPPCLYVVVDLTRGPLIGHYFESTGQTGELLAGSMELGAMTGRIVTGTFRATFAKPRDGGILTAFGSFRACAPRMPACRS